MTDTRYTSGTRRRAPAGSNAATQATQRPPARNAQLTPLVRFIVLPLLTAVGFVLLGVIVSCVGGFAVM